MKILRFLFFLFLLILGVMIFLSQSNKEVKMETRTIINAPVSQCFMTFVDPIKMVEWMPDFKSIEFVSGFPSAVGSQYKLKFDIDGHEMVIDETITAFEFNKLFAATLHNPMMDAEVEVSFNDVNGNTELVVRQITRPKGFINRVFTGLVKGDIVERDRQAYDNLKALIEN